MPIPSVLTQPPFIINSSQATLNAQVNNEGDTGWWGFDLPAPTVNYDTNPALAVNTTDWSSSGATTVTGRVASTAFVSGYGYQLTLSDITGTNVSTYAAADTRLIPVVAGETIGARMKMLVGTLTSGTSSSARITLRVWDSSGDDLGTLSTFFTQTDPVTGTTYDVPGYWTADSILETYETAATASIYGQIQFDGEAGATGTVLFGDVLLTTISGTTVPPFGYSGTPGWVLNEDGTSEGPQGTVNQFINPGIGTTVTYYSASKGTNSFVTAGQGQFTANATGTAGISLELAGAGTRFWVGSGNTYTAAVAVTVGTAIASGITPRIEWHDGAGNLLSTTTGTAVLVNVDGSAIATVTGTVPSGAVYGTPTFYFTSVTGTEVFYFTGAGFAQGSTTITFAGSQAGYEWLGTANDSASIQVGTWASFNWGTTAEYGNSTTWQPTDDGDDTLDISATLTGLTAGQTYHYQVVGQNSSGIVYGDDINFIPITGTTIINNLNLDYSGISINYDYQSTGLLTIDDQTIAQTFILPTNYTRGTNVNEIRIPDISGLQIYSYIDTGESTTASYAWQIGYTYIDNPSNIDQFNIIDSGTTTGTYKDGSVWFDILFDQPIIVTSDLINLTWIVTLTPTNIASISYFEYNSQGYNPNIQAYTLEYSYSLNQATLVGIADTPASFNFRLLTLTADSGTDFMEDQYRSIVTTTSVENISTTNGGSNIGGIGGYWLSPALPAPDAVASLYFDMRQFSDTPQSNQLSDTPVVIDALIFEPLFANQDYTLYYSNDDDGITGTPITTAEWENKLWTRAISETTNFGNETNVLPSPIVAKYLKIELSNPQLQPYNPGQFQLPIPYKTFPSWVRNYFLGNVNYPNYTVDQIIVQNDALSTLYTPSLTDLDPIPSIPSVPTSSTYSTTPGTSLDNTTLSQIALNPSPYQDTLGAEAGIDGTIISAIVNQQINNTLNGAQQITEATPPTYPPITTVSSLQRDSVLAEYFFPSMYFYQTCRHAYMKKTAILTNNKAYFFGVNSITFLRSQGNVVTDTSVYTETGVDSANSMLNDFTVIDGIWYA